MKPPATKKPTARSAPAAPPTSKRPARASKAPAKPAAARAVERATPTRPAALRVAPERVAALHARLAAENPAPHCELRFETPWQLLIATILSAQSTDKTVNRVMPDVLARWPTPQALGAADPAEVEEVVHSTGFFRNKARAIRETSRALAERHGGEVPRDLASLVALPGVARKTANVVLGTAYGLPSGIAVDVHAARVSQRLGLTQEKLPEKIEQVLCRLFPEGEWVCTGHRLVLHGRYVCTARAPRCEACPLNELCPSRESAPRGDWQARAEAVRREMASRAEGFRTLGTQA